MSLSTRATAVAAIIALCSVPNSTSFAPITPHGRTRQTSRFVSQLEKPSADEAVANIPDVLRTSGQGIPPRNSHIQLIDASTYESQLIQSWSSPESQKGFDWEIEKARRYFAGLRLREDGNWVKQPSFFDFLVNQSRAASMNSDAPKPVNLLDVISLVTINILTNLGFGTGMAAVPDAVIQKYEGSFLSFIKGVLGGDLQTLAGGPLFLLLAKYYHDYGPIFNLSFGPKSFLVVSDPVMARHILRESTAEQYCKGMLAEILEPIMGKGLIPADPATWKVRAK
jgi:Cytochrome P450